MPNPENSCVVGMLPAQFRTFVLPAAEEGARSLRRVRLAEQGEIRSEPESR
jgi:hypothetical protein